jgi:Aldo/keto reductase family
MSIKSTAAVYIDAAAAGTTADTAAAQHTPRLSSSLSSSYFRICPIAAQATSMLDGIPLVPKQVNSDKVDNNSKVVNDDDSNNYPTTVDTTAGNNVVIMPWIAFGTYKLGAATARRTVRDALAVGYRHIDTAFIYGQETTETLVGLAIQDAIQQNIITSRQQVFITTKHWRTYHGYTATLQCLNLSLQRLQVDYIDLWLMVRNNDLNEKREKWHFIYIQRFLLFLFTIRN